jgi:hypothetical protein
MSINLKKFLKFIKHRDDCETIKNVVDEYRMSITKDVNRKYEATIYRIFCNDPDIKDSYVGHTIKPILHRMYHHTKTCQTEGYRYHNKKLYCFIRENGGLQNFSFEIIETCNATISEVRDREQNFINLLKPSLNKIEAKVVYL